MQEIVQLVRGLADETRLRLLAVLCEGPATVSDLVVRLGLPQPRISTHLALLRRVNVVRVEVVGRQRTYSVEKARIEALFVALRGLLPATRPGPRASAQAAREVRRNTTLRQGRTCYDHLAGVVGVQLLDALQDRGWVEVQPGARPHYHLTPEGTQALLTRGIDVPEMRHTRRRFAYGCLDWTERRAHLGGALGAAILTALEQAGYVQRHTASRALTLRKPLTTWLEAVAPTS